VLGSIRTTVFESGRAQIFDETAQHALEFLCHPTLRVVLL
jgi:hypothetical protein